MACCNRTENPFKNEFWLARLPGGLPADFDYNVVRSVGDARALILTLPNCDRAQAAVRLFCHRNPAGIKAARDGTGLSISEIFDRPIVANHERFDYLIAAWRRASERHQHCKSALELQRHPTADSRHLEDLKSPPTDELTTSARKPMPNEASVVPL